MTWIVVGLVCGTLVLIISIVVIVHNIRNRYSGVFLSSHVKEKYHKQLAPDGAGTLLYSVRNSKLLIEPHLVWWKQQKVLLRTEVEKKSKENVVHESWQYSFCKIKKVLSKITNTRRTTKFQIQSFMTFFERSINQNLLFEIK